MTRYRITRGQELPLVAGRGALLGDPGRRLCCAMARAFETERSGPDAEQAELEEYERARATDYWSGLPWMTPVLGSGCLDSGDRAGIDGDALAQAVARAAARLGEAPEGSESWGTIAERFTRSLSRDRLSRGGAAAAAAEVEVGDVGVRLVLIAALLTRLCHAARAMDPTAIGRLADETVVLDLARPAVDDPFDLGGTVIAPLKQLIREVQELLSSPAGGAAGLDQVNEAVLALDDAILQSLRKDSPEVSLNAVRLVTEAAWYFLVSRADAYYGWTEMLLGLILLESTPSTRSFRRKRPRFWDLKALPKLVGGLFENATAASWAARAADPVGDGGGRSFHDAVAEVLDAQAHAAVARPEWTAGDRILPLAVAFSTSFDLELEMALWSRGRPFSVALPVHLIRTPKSVDVDLCWLVGDVDPPPAGGSGDGLDELRRPRRWRLLSADDSLDPRRPVVVRLTGSPLTRLDSLNVAGADRRSLEDQLESAGIRDLPELARFEPAVTVDEYLALRQAEVELFWAVRRPTDSKGLRGLGLNPRLTDSGAGLAMPRYWALMGVPVADRAVRHRLMSPLTARWIWWSTAEDRRADDDDADGILGPGDAGIAALDLLGGSAPADDPASATLTAPRRALPAASLQESLSGIAVNSRVDEDEAFLLSWLGLTVVTCDCRDFTDDFADYALHLRTDDARRRLSSDTCGLR